MVRGDFSHCSYSSIWRRVFHGFLEVCLIMKVLGFYMIVDWAIYLRLLSLWRNLYPIRGILFTFSHYSWFQFFFMSSFWVFFVFSWSFPFLFLNTLVWVLGSIHLFSRSDTFEYWQSLPFFADSIKVNDIWVFRVLQSCGYLVEIFIQHHLVTEKSYLYLAVATTVAWAFSKVKRPNGMSKLTSKTVRTV